MLAGISVSFGCSSSSFRPFPITGNYSLASLNGNYAFILSGTRTTLSNGLPVQSAYREAGVFVANGNGSITSGSEDLQVSGVFPGFSSTSFTLALAASEFSGATYKRI